MVLQILIDRTVWGFKLRAVGENISAARHAGISVNKTLLGVAICSGALAGLAGVSEVAGLKGYLTADLSPGFGYTGIVVAMLAGLSPVGVVALLTISLPSARKSQKPWPDNKTAVALSVPSHINSTADLGFAVLIE